MSTPAKLVAPKMRLTPSTPGTDAGSQTLFDQFGTINAVEAYLAAPPAAGVPPLDPTTIANLTAVLEADRTRVSNQIAANIMAATATGQPTPDVVVDLSGNGWLINATNGVPALYPAVVVNASDIPLVATPPTS
jgi:hypothetical protein